MKHTRLFLLALASLMIFSINAFAQDGPPPEGPPDQERRDDRRPDLLAELGLSPDQVQRIRQMNRERRPLMMEAQRRVREANRNLDMAIYADRLSEVEYEARLKEFQAARAELARLRFDSELSVRRVLTPEQLVRFREIRLRFTEERGRRNRPFQRGRGGRRPAQDGPVKRPSND